MASKIVNVRINDKLQEKLNKLICDMQKELPKGVEVNISSLIRGALEQMIQDYEDERHFVVSAKLSLVEASLEELKAIKELKVGEGLKLANDWLEHKEKGECSKVNEKQQDKVSKDLKTIEYFIKRKKEKEGE